MNHADTAESLFVSGYNCAQAVLLAYQPELGLDEKSLLRMSSSLGGGMGGMREICGAVNAMFLVIGLKYGPEDPSNQPAKAAHYASLRQLAHEFQSEYGALRCGDLLKALKDHLPESPAVRTPDYYAKRPCTQLVCNATRLIDEYCAAHDAQTSADQDNT